MVLRGAQGHLNLHIPVKGVGESQAVCSAGRAQNGADAAGPGPSGGFTLQTKTDIQAARKTLRG